MTGMHFIARRFDPKGRGKQDLGAFPTQEQAWRKLVDAFSLGDAARKSFRRWGSYRNFSAIGCACGTPETHEPHQSVAGE